MFAKAAIVVVLAIGLAYWSCPWTLHYVGKFVEIQQLTKQVSVFLPWLSNKHQSAVDIEAIIDGLEEMIQTPDHCLTADKKLATTTGTGKQRKFKNIAVGINANVDLIVSGTKMLQALDIRPGSPKDHSQIFSKEQLQQAFHYHFRRGAAAERPFLNREMYKDIVSKKISNSHEFIGGNAALIAWNIMHQFPEVKVTLVGPIGPKLLNLLTPKINVPEFSQFDEDEIHLIMEYEKGEVWGPSKAPVASRFITAHDRSNANAIVMDLYFNVAENGKFDLMVLSGLHMMDSQPEAQWRLRLAQLSRRLVSVPSWKPVHLELASMTSANFVLEIAEKILSKISSLGLNEQELLLLSQVGKGPHQSLKTGNRLDIEKVGDTVHWLLAKYGKNVTDSRLSRVHFHTLAFHLTAVRGRWSNQESATGAGARAAAQKACATRKLDPALLDLKIDLHFKLHSESSLISFNATRPITTWKSPDDVTMIFSPVLVCKKPVKTVGLGDLISATGLMYSTYVS